MSWETANKYGVLKVEGKSVKMYTSQNAANIIPVGSEVKDARWSGSDLLVFLEDGKVRRYKNFNTYNTI